VHHKHIRRNLLILSLANWAIAIIAWSISAYLGMSRPTGIFVYTVLFVIGIFAVIVAIAAYLLEKFAHEPGDAAAEAAPGGDAGPTAEPGA
jgi:hypothetical protein